MKIIHSIHIMKLFKPFHSNESCSKLISKWVGKFRYKFQQKTLFQLSTSPLKKLYEVEEFEKVGTCLLDVIIISLLHTDV